MKETEMSEDDPILSELTHVYKEAGKQVTVEIYSDGEGKWIVEILDDRGNSFVGENLFETELDALAEFQKDVKQNGIDFFIGESA